MSDVRVYLPLAGTDLDTLARPGGSVSPTTAYAVTAALRGACPEADEEELEFIALNQAAEAAGRLRGGERGRRVVGAADVDVPAVREDPDPREPARIEVRTAVPRRAFVSLHVDEQPGSDGALLWYDITELDAVRDLR